MRRSNADALSRRTIADFGEQWANFRENDGYYGSDALFADLCMPLLSPEEVRGSTVAEIGSGTGRIVEMLINAGAAHVVAVEPSGAYDVLRDNMLHLGSRVECVHTTGDQLPRDRAFDLVVSIGALHHIPDPASVLHASYEALRPGGRLFVWLYGREGNRAYLAAAAPLRLVTTRLPHGAVVWIATLFNALLKPYAALCHRFRLPLREYLVNVFGRMTNDKQILIIYDQLRPAFAKYYTKHEATELLHAAGFHDIKAHHRHGYSWSVIGTKPDGPKR